MSLAMHIPMSAPDVTTAEIEAVKQVLTTPYLSIGPQVQSFERKMAEFTGVKHAIAVSNGTAGLHLAVIAASISEGDEVITTPFSFVSSANCILYERATPVFVDIDPQTLNIDPQLVEAAISPRTKAILPVHAFGQPADMDPILEIARRHELYVIEDACEAVGAEYKGRKAGTLGDIGIFAFYPNKQMTTGEGGIILTNRDDWNDLLRSLRNQGRDTFNAWLDHNRLGYNYRLDEMSAALGVVQLSRLEELLAKRAGVASRYQEQLRSVETVQVPYISPNTTRMSWFVYVVRLSPEIDRDQVMIDLERGGIPSRPYFSCIHLLSFYRNSFGFKPGDFRVAERVAKSTLALPFHGKMSEAEVSYVCEGLMSAIKRQLS
jgi:dTDP-4-amino-4,6-dideoxygalactose transaminase